MRARAGQRVEETAREADGVDNLIRRVIPPEDLGTVLDNIGLFNSTINTTYSNSGVIGESDAEILIGLKPERKQQTRYYIDALRQRLAEEFPGTQFFFQPADMISQILNFGVPAPVDIQLIGPNEKANYLLAEQITNRIQHIPGAVDVHVQQLRSYPAIFLNVDRTRVQSVGLSQQDVANSVLLTLSSSFQVTPSFWVNPANGYEYNVAVQVPQYKIDSMQSLDNIPISSALTKTPQILGNMGTLSVNTEPALLSQYDTQPMMDVYASVEGRDLGGVDADIQKVLADFQDKLPRGTQLVRRGQVATMTSSFAGLSAGRGRRHRSGLSADRRELSIVDRSLYHHYGAARSAGRDHLDPAADAHHAERAVADRHDHVHGRGHGQQHPDGVLRARTLERRTEFDSGGGPGGVCAHSPRADDRVCHDHRHGAAVARARRRRRAERSAGPGRDRRADRRHIRNFVFCALRIFVGSQRASSGRGASAPRNLELSSRVMNSGSK